MNAALTRNPLIASPPIAILGVPFDNVSASEAIAMIDKMVASRKPHYLVTANVDFLVQAREDVELRRILFDAHLVLCDGTPLLWASRLLGNPLPERVAGADLVPLLIKAAAQKKYRLFFLGATEEASGRAVQKLQSLYPGLLIAGHYAPPFNKLLEMDHEAIRSRILEAKPDLLFVSFGCPKQEKWIAMHYRSLGVPVAVGVGATIDFLAGSVKRAPVWMQKCGLEWTFRLAQEPRRLFRRYVKDIWVFGRSLMAQWYRLQLPSRRSRPNHASSALRTEPAWQWIKLPPRFDIVSVRSDNTLLEQISADERHCLLEMSCTEFLDSTGVGFLIRLQKRLHTAGHYLILLAPSAPVMRTLELMRLAGFFNIASDLASARSLIETRAREESATNAIGSPTSFLRWYGEVTAANIEQVWKRTESFLGAASGNELTIDLTEVRFIDSSALGLMVRAKRVAQNQLVILRFTGIQPPILNVIRLAHLEEFLLNRSAKVAPVERTRKKPESEALVA